jgi:hypothetical protein
MKDATINENRGHAEQYGNDNALHCGRIQESCAAEKVRVQREERELRSGLTGKKHAAKNAATTESRVAVLMGSFLLHKTHQMPLLQVASRDLSEMPQVTRQRPKEQ